MQDAKSPQVRWAASFGPSNSRTAPSGICTSIPQERASSLVNAFDDPGGNFHSNGGMNGYGRKFRFNQHRSTGLVEEIGFPCRQAATDLVYQRLQVSLAELGDAQWDAKVFDWERVKLAREETHQSCSVFKVTLNWRDETFVTVSLQPGGATKEVQDGMEQNQVLLFGCKEDNNIVCIKKSPLL
jgi:hypothetical protein